MTMSLREKRSKSSTVIEVKSRANGQWRLPKSERLVWDTVRSITLAVRAFQLAHGDWRRRGARCGGAGGRAISPG